MIMKVYVYINVSIVWMNISYVGSTKNVTQKRSLYD